LLDAARAALASLSEEWLLLIDGADDVDAMSRHWPPGNCGNILYTSRNPLLKHLALDSVAEVAGLDNGDAVQLLLDAARLLPASGAVTQLAVTIVHRLGNLALAVHQARAYIAQGECRIYDFLDTFERSRAHLHSVDTYNRASLYKQAIYATWELSCSAIERKATGALHHDSPAVVARNALQLLSMLACFHFEEVTEDIFRRAAENPRRG
jgi:hypothetical protein